MSARFAKLRKALETQNWKGITTLFKKWPEGEERETALEYAERHLTDWPLESRLATKPESHGCWELVRYWKMGKADHDFVPVLQNSPNLRVVSFPSNSLSYYFNILKECPHITHIELSNYSDMHVWENYLLKLPHLRSIRFEKNQLPDLRGIKKLQHLEELHLGECSTMSNIEALQDISSLRKLTALYPNTSTLAPLTSSVGLEHLELHGAGNLSDLEALRSFPELKTVRLTWARNINDLSPLENCPKLEVLDLAGAEKVTSLEPLGHCPKLRELNLWGCKSLDSLHGLENLQHLQKLTLTSSKVDSMEPLRSLARLQDLNMGDIQGDIDPDILLSLTGLRSLDLSQNKKVKELPSLVPLKSLHELSLSGTNITSLEFLRGVESLDTLLLQDCKQLLTLDGLEIAQKLYQLDLSRSRRLRDIQALESLTSLEFLEFYDNLSLTSGDSLQNLTSLHSLSLQRCRELRSLNLVLPVLKELTISDCSKLETLDITGCVKLEQLNASSNNRLTSINGLHSATKLKELDVSWNRELEILEGLDSLPKLKPNKTNLQGCPKLPNGD